MWRWMGDKCPTVCFSLVQQHGLSPGDVPSYSALQHEVVIICWDGLAGSLVVCLSGLSGLSLSLCSNGIGTTSQQCQAGLGSSPRARRSLRQNPRRLGPAPAQLAPSTSPPHRIARLECLYPGLRLVSQTAFLTVPHLPSARCPLLVSLGSAPCSRVARPRRNTATFASPPWLVLHCQWLTSPRLGGQIRDCVL